MTQNKSLETASRLTTQYEVEGQVVQLIICISGIQLMNNGKIFLETATRLITQYEVEGQVGQSSYSYQLIIMQYGNTIKEWAWSGSRTGQVPIGQWPPTCLWQA